MKTLPPAHPKTLYDGYLISPDPKDPTLSTEVTGIDQSGAPIVTRVVTEKPLTLYLNSQEIVTMMTIGDHPDLLAVGYLANQNMLPKDKVISSIDYDEELGVVVVRTDAETNFEQKMAKRIRTSGCAQGTVFGDVIDNFDQVKLPQGNILKTSWIADLSKIINTTPSLYLEAGAIHGCVLCQENKPLVYMEDVGRHNAVDKIAGWMVLNKTDPSNKMFYTTGRLTSEMVIKTAMMGISIIISRSGFTAWGVELARSVDMTLIGRARGSRFNILAGRERVIFDADPEKPVSEADHHHRKASIKTHD